MLPEKVFKILHVNMNKTQVVHVSVTSEAMVQSSLHIKGKMMLRLRASSSVI